ncbi:glycosyltransferase [Mycolicibacterium celeriflavum]|uniref:glycosyltransferase n=1 Tax=Mycolicibacterium celeriflavum TaxID=1249101 RepID=UPI003CF08453
MTSASSDLIRPAEYSARRVLTDKQAWFLAVLLAALVLGAAINWRATATLLLGLSAAYFVVSTTDRLVLMLHALDGRTALRISDKEALALPEKDLPKYTVLLPVYDEPDIVETLVRGIGLINYPRDKLEVLLIMEADDEGTINAFPAAQFDWVTPVLVPPSEPRTKPKACNYALSRHVLDSDFTTIYDAEDVPDPLQLRRVVAAFSRHGPEVAAVQCRLGFYNERQNLLTKWFSLEYDQWFSYVLSSLAATGCVVLLGGTSNHVRTSVLRNLGGWDAFNVTEDADLGVLLARSDHRTLVLDSVTLEEANADVINWVRQRSRWYKGYLQTFFVHFRKPLAVSRQLGLKPTLRLLNFTAGMPLACMLNLGFWTLMSIWYLGKSDLLDDLYAGPVYYLCLFLFTVGNAITILAGLVSTRAMGKPYLSTAALLVPGYWVLQALAAVKAISQLVYKSSYWEKTVHGLTVAKKA